MRKKKALVLGFGVSGKGAAALLQSQGFSVVAADRKAETILAMEGVSLISDQGEMPWSGVELVIASPGIDPSHPVLVRAKELQIPLYGELDWALGSLKNRAVGITGTNGKTTTCLLTTHLLQHAGLPAKAAGNVGVPLSEVVMSLERETILVIELSSFQLETARMPKLDGGVFLNLTPDHLDRYKTLRDYAAAKANLAHCLKTQAPFFVAESVRLAYPDLFQRALPFESSSPHFSLEEIRKGVPEPQNRDAAFALCSLFGVSRDVCEAGLSTFRRPPHRMEWVGEKNGVHYYNDSKGTNIDAVVHGLKSFSHSVILLLGGVDKGASYAPWIEALRGKVKQMIAYGEAAIKMEKELAPFFPFERVHTLEEALKKGEAIAIFGDQVVLSPGCSSFDQFRNYAHRGEEFKRMVNQPQF